MKRKLNKLIVCVAVLLLVYPNINYRVHATTGEYQPNPNDNGADLQAADVIVSPDTYELTLTNDATDVLRVPRSAPYSGLHISGNQWSDWVWDGVHMTVSGDRIQFYSLDTAWVYPFHMIVEAGASIELNHIWFWHTTQVPAIAIRDNAIIHIYDNVKFTSANLFSGNGGSLTIVGHNNATLELHATGGVPYTNNISQVNLRGNMTVNLRHDIFATTWNKDDQVKVNVWSPPHDTTISYIGTSTVIAAIRSFRHLHDGIWLYKLNDGEWQTERMFTGLQSSTTYTLHKKFVGTASKSSNLAFESEVGSTTFVTSDPQYTVTIPAIAVADGSSTYISINNDLDLGSTGQVKVDVADNSGGGNGRLDLFHTELGNRLRAHVFINDVHGENFGRNIANFTQTETSPVAIRFALYTADAHAFKPAGTYTGTINFAISYTK